MSGLEETGAEVLGKYRPDLLGIKVRLDEGATERAEDCSFH